MTNEKKPEEKIFYDPKTGESGTLRELADRVVPWCR